MSTAVMKQPGVAAQAHGHDHDHEHDSHGNTVYGFWLYLMTDCILFACVFATYAVLVNSTAGGPTGADIFELPFVLTETFVLLFSSVTFGFAMLNVYRQNKSGTLVWLGITGLLGATFIGMEVYEFHHLISIGAGPDRSAFLSAFFSLVGMHGLHVTAGILWLIVMMIQVGMRGITTQNTTRLSCLSLFWHFLDIVWICVFTVVYLMGAA